jgi:hypothetical protein
MMKCILVLLLSISLSQAIVRFCCYETLPGTTDIAITQTQCYTPYNTKCFSDLAANATFNYGCAGDSGVSSSATTCTTDFCNCPAEVHKTATAVGWFFGEMRKIMYPIMGMVFGVIWIILAFIGGGPTEVILLIVAIVDAIFGILLIFLPVTTYLGLFYVAVGAITIAVVKHSIGGKAGLYFIIGLTLLIFLLTGGLTFIAYSAPYFDNVAGSITGCEGSMNILNLEDKYWNLDTRCENYALFVGFCVFLLFLVQPIALLSLLFLKSGGKGNGSHGGHSGSHAPGSGTNSPSNT